MNNCKKIIALALAVFSISAIKADAEGTWLDKGISILNALDENRTSKEPGIDEIGQAFKEALRIGSENVTGRLGNFDGFNADSAVHIPLPEKLNALKTVLNRIGMSSMLNDLEVKLNRAAENAAQKAKGLFLKSISEMTFEDIKGIYEGPENAATKYFRRKMSSSLQKEMGQIVEKSLSEVGAVQVFDNAIGKCRALPFVPDIKTDLTGHVVQKGMDGIFYYIAKEEAAIRKDPLKQTSALLKKVFGRTHSSY